MYNNIIIHKYNIIIFVLLIFFDVLTYNEDALIGFSIDNMQVKEFIVVKIQHILACTAQVQQNALQKCKNMHCKSAYKFMLFN